MLNEIFQIKINKKRLGTSFQAGQVNFKTKFKLISRKPTGARLMFVSEVRTLAPDPP